MPFLQNWIIVYLMTVVLANRVILLLVKKDITED